MPIDVAYPENRIKAVLEDANPVLTIFDDSCNNLKAFDSNRWMMFETIKKLSRTMENKNIASDQMLSKDDSKTLAAVFYTSGSSGVPKGVKIRHFTIFHHLIWHLETFPYLQSEKHCVFKTALVFIDHMAELWCPIICGKPIVIVPREILMNPETFLRILEDYEIERFIGVPTLIRNILMYLNMLKSNKTKFLLSKLKILQTSGEPLTMKLVNDFLEYFDHGIVSSSTVMDALKLVVIFHGLKFEQSKKLSHLIEFLLGNHCRTQKFTYWMRMKKSYLREKPDKFAVLVSSLLTDTSMKKTVNCLLKIYWNLMKVSTNKIFFEF